MAVTNYTTETNYCDFCGEVQWKEDLFMVFSGAPMTDWRELVCGDCDSGVSSYSDLRVFALGALEIV